MTSSHTVAAKTYANAVVSGKKLACKLTISACQRQLNDLKRQKTKAFPYYFDTKEANRVCNFVELMPHIKGEWAKRGEAIKLEPWQKFILTTVFGWKRVDNNQRRFRLVYEEVARKNAKSTIMSAVGLFMLGPDGEAGAEIYSAASKRDQARIVFNAAQEMARRSPEYQEKYGVDVLAHTIACRTTAGRFQALDGEGKTQDGLNVHLAILDELHAHKNRGVYDVLETAVGSRSQPLIWAITTAGSDQSGICYELRNYAVKVIDDVVQDETMFAIVYTMDKDDDWTSPDTWAKANPNLGVSFYQDELERLRDKAVASPSFQNTFLTKHLNVWVNAATAWMNMLQWQDCADPSLDVGQFEGEGCVIGLDLSSKIDIASKVRVFERMIDNERHYYVFAEHYLPSETIRDSGNAAYSGWVRSGHLTATEGNVIDLDLLEESITLEDSTRFLVEEVAYDPWQATQLAQHLQVAGVPVVEVRPTVGNFSEPMKELEALVIDGRLHHDGDPVLSWMVSNVVAFRDAKDNIYPRKENPANKIDGVVALIMALARLVTQEQSGPSVYETTEAIM